MNLKTIAKILVNRSKTVLLVYLIITILVGTQITNLTMESDLKNYLPKDDPTIELLEKVYDEFEIGDSIIILVEADNIRNSDVLREMDYVVNNDDVDRYPDNGQIDGIKSVNSLAVLIKNENFLNGIGDSKGEYIVPDDENTIYSYMTRFTIEKAKGTLYTNDYKYAVILMQLAKNANYEEILAKTKASIERRGNDDTIMSITGYIAINYAMREQTLTYLEIVLGLAALFVALFLIAFHRSLKGVLIGFLPVLSAVILTFGVLGIVSPELTLLSVAIVALMLGLGIDYSIYLSNRYAEEYKITNKVERINKTLGKTGKAVFLCAFSTIIGFGSLMTSSMPPMVSFGLGCAIGISFAFLSSTILVPCLCIVLKFEKKEEIHQWKKFAKILINYRKKFFFIAIFFSVISILLISQVKTDVNFFGMAPEGIEEIDSLFKYSEKFGSNTNFNAIYIETEKQGLTYPEVINKIYNMEGEIRNTGATAYSIADELVDINRLLNRSYIIEKLAELVDLQKIIFDKIADTGIIDENYSKTIILVTFPVEKSIKELENTVKKINIISSQSNIPHNGHASNLIGQDVISVEINKRIMSSQTTSMIVALLLVLSCLIIGFRSTVIGFLALMPVLFVLSWEPGTLVALNIPLSVVNVTVASIMIGTGIDYSIQTTMRIKEECEKGLPKIDAVKTALETTGLSIFGASLTTTVALLSTFFVPIPTLYQFSILIISLIVLSLTASLFILPTTLSSKFLK